MSLRSVQIHYRRLPDRLQLFEQVVLEDAGEYVVTFVESTLLTAPVRIEGEVVLDPGAPVVWFTYPGRWYDVGRFHRADGAFTGIYVNILTPVRMEGDRWETTDLCLDVWMGADGRVLLLDEAEFERAVESGWIDPPTAASARAHAESLAARARHGGWPPAEVQEWTLARARFRVRD